MLIMAHTGITLGIFGLLHRVFLRISLYRKKRKGLTFSTKLAPANPGLSATSRKWQVDYRFILLGSIFPDIVDKPLGMVIFANLLTNGRIITHTLFVNLILVGIGIYLITKKKHNFLLFALASCFHLVLDKMWLELQTLLWPLYGWGFPREDISHWWNRIFHNLATVPGMYVPEIIGAIILVIFAIILVKTKMVGKFLREGVVS